MITNSAERILLADHSKFGSIYPATFGSPSDFDRLVTDMDTDTRAIDKFADKGVEVVVAG